MYAWVKTAIHYQSELARHPSSLADFQTDVPTCLDFTASPFTPSSVLGN
jgi:hypothetical protein